MKVARKILLFEINDEKILEQQNHSFNSLELEGIVPHMPANAATQYNKASSIRGMQTV